MQPKSMFMMPWYPRDFASSTIGWPLIARGAYRELLDAQWEMGRLPIERADLRRICGASESEWKRAWPLIEPKFPIQDGFRLNLKLESHRARSLEIYEKRRESSLIANKTRWQTDPKRIPNGSHQSQSLYINPKSPEAPKSATREPGLRSAGTIASAAIARMREVVGDERHLPDDGEIPF